MTEYSPITDAQIESESPIDATLATQWRDNPIAITEGSAGAPKIQSAAMGANSVLSAAIVDANVPRAKLKTATVSLAGTIPVNGYTDIIMTGGGYAFFPMIHAIGGGVGGKSSIYGHSTDGADPDSPRFSLSNSDINFTGSYDIDYRYIDA